MIGLHSGALYAKPYGYYLHALIFRLGVPFFFLCAGYFLGRKTTAENRKQVFGAYIKKLLLTYFLWNVFYVPYSLYLGNNLTVVSLLNGIWWTITMQSATVMWFVGALIWSVIILLHFADEKKLPLILAISAAIYVIGLSFNTYNFLFLGTRFEVVINWLVDRFYYNRNAWFCGFYYVAFGYWLSKVNTPKWMNTQKKRTMIIGTTLSGWRLGVSVASIRV